MSITRPMDGDVQGSRVSNLEAALGMGRDKFFDVRHEKCQSF